MKFITESDLRQQYKEQAFGQYLLAPQTRLTPEANQFLIDRKIQLVPVEMTEVVAPVNEATLSDVLKRIHKDYRRISSLLLLVISSTCETQQTLAESLAKLADYLQMAHQAFDLEEPLPVAYFESQQVDQNEQLTCSTFQILQTNGLALAWLNMVYMSCLDSLETLSELIEEYPKRTDLADLQNVYCLLEKQLAGLYNQLRKGDPNANNTNSI